MEERNQTLDLGNNYLSFDDGYYGMQEWVVITNVDDERVYFDVLQGEEEGRSMSKPITQFLREYYYEENLNGNPIRSTIK